MMPRIIIGHISRWHIRFLQLESAFFFLFLEFNLVVHCILTVLLAAD